MGGLQLFGLVVLGGLVGLDGTSVGQFMVSRPLIAGALAGWIVGDPATGIAMGAVLELFLLVSFPTGGSRFPEGSTATVVAVGTASAVGGPGALPLGVALGLAWGHLGGSTVTALRKANTRAAAAPGRPMGPGRVGRALTRGIGMDFARAVLLTAAGLTVGTGLLSSPARAWPLSDDRSLALLIVGGFVSAGISLHGLGGARARGLWFLTGAAMGVAAMRIL